MSWPGAPWWKAHERSGWYQIGNTLGTRGGALVLTRFSWSRLESSSAYVIGIGSNCILRACSQGCCWCWRLGRCWNCDWFCEATSEATRVLSLSNSPWSVVTSSRMLVDFLFKLICSFFLFAQVFVGASWHWTRTVEPLLKPVDHFMEKKILWDSDSKLWNARWCMMFMPKWSSFFWRVYRSEL